MYCVLCTRPRTGNEWSCECGSDLYTEALSSGAQPPVVSNVLQGPLAGLVTLAPLGSLLLHGPKGVGKTTLALLAFNKPAVITTEMSPDQVIRYAQRLRREVPCVAPPAERVSEEGISWSWCHEAAGADGLVVDSINGVADPIGFWRWVRAEARARGLPVVLVAQNTTDGTVRSGTTIPHEVDVVVRAEPQRGQVLLHAEKCRFGELVGSRLWSLREVAPAFYVVVGEAPYYRLEAWPWASSPVYDAAETGQLSLPTPPIAVAARHTRLCGWMEPPDSEARAAFAEASGVPYWRPQ